MTEGIQIPGYQIVRELGRGGTATVYLAVQNSFGREVALKIMSPLLNQDPTFAPRFIREARIVSQMHHASIVPVFDVGEHRRHHYLSMELLPGGDLRRKIVEGQCGPSAALKVCLAMASALELAHRKGFVHRDIKPQNILFREDGTPVLTDFGIARAIDVGTSLTAAGMFVGTPSYMSPEQVKGLELDGRSDLYSLGIVFYEMLIGTVPFHADSALSIALKHLSDPLPALPAELARYQAFLNRLTAKDKEERFASSAAVIRALSAMTDVPAARGMTLVRERAFDDDAGLASVTQSATHFVPRPPTRTRWAWTGIAALAVLAAAIAATFATRLPRKVSDEPIAAAPAPAAIPETPVATRTADLPGNPPIPTASAAPTPAADAQPPINIAATKTADRPPATAATPVPERKAPAVQQRSREAQEAQRREVQMASLLADAQANLQRGALVAPAEPNAADQFRAILQLDAQRPEALDGLRQVTDALIANAERQRKAGEVDAALESLAQARSINAGHPRIARLQADLEERKVKLQRRAQENLMEAGEHITKARIYLDRQPVTLRNVAEANDHYDEAVEIAAAAPELNALRERILTGYTAAAQSELSRKQPERALKVVAYARKRSMSSPTLEQLAAQIDTAATGR